jgi:glutaminyl-tRNA synthetase
MADVSERSNFIRDEVDRDLASGRYARRVITRFPPEPNGYLHIGHAKAICVNFTIAGDYGGVCHLRFDDTNPVSEKSEFVEGIEGDIRWLGFDWGERTYYASDYFPEMYRCAEILTERGLAYVDSQTVEEMRKSRGSVSEAGTPSPYRSRPREENLDLLRRMRAGEFPDGSHVVRAKIDMASPNMLLRDPPLYRIRHAHHHRTGDAWCIYPMYDFAHCLEDAFEGVSHSLCSLEFETRRALYDWLLDTLGPDGLADARARAVAEREAAGVEVPEAELRPDRPRQIEFARLAMSSTVMSKRYLTRLVEDGLVSGWDDPRMPSLRGFRRGGVRPEAIRAFIDMGGVAKANSTVDLGKLEYCIREDLNDVAPRVMCVLRPLRVVVTNYPAGGGETIDAPYWPRDVGKEGSRPVPFSREILIERDDFAEEPPPKWFRLAPGKEVRLRYSYVVRCDEVVKDDAGEVIELRCTYDPDSAHGKPLGRRVRGTLHWVSAPHALPCEVRLYDRLFKVEAPDTNAPFADVINPDSLVVLTDSLVEPSVAGDPTDGRYQFERQGYFWRDPVDSSPERLVFNRIVSLKDAWARIAARGEGKADPRPARRKAPTAAPPASTIAEERVAARAADPDLAARYARYTTELGLDDDVADRLTGDVALARFYDDAVGAHGNARSVANVVVNTLLGELKETSVEELRFGGRQLGELVRLVDEGTISATAGKEVLSVLLREGGDPERIVRRKNLRQMNDASALEPIVDGVLAGDPDAVARYRAGKTGLLGFFLGVVMRTTGGSANPALVKQILEERLAE